MGNEKHKNVEQMPSEERRGSTDQAGIGRKVAQDAQELRARRQEKILEHLATTLDSANTLQACLGPVACDTFEMLAGLKDGINEALATGPMALEQFENLRSTIELYARLAGLAYKLSDLDYRIERAQETR